jgi:signal transduction histidine kinase
MRGPSIIDDLQEDTPLTRLYRRITGAVANDEPYRRFRSWLGVPLIHKDEVIGMLALAATTPSFYRPRHGRLALAFANQVATAIENARLYASAQQLAALEERQRLARELHDSVTQTLFSMSMVGDALPQIMERDPERARERIARLNDLARGALAEMRALIFELRPESLEHEGLTAALEKQAAALRSRHELAVDLTLCPEPDLPLEIKDDLYRIAREALHNVVKHANATHLSVLLVRSTDAITLAVSDDGAGFDPSGDFPGHLGLRSMRERVARLGGQLVIESAPGRGTRIRARIPV